MLVTDVILLTVSTIFVLELPVSEELVVFVLTCTSILIL